MQQLLAALRDGRGAISTEYLVLVGAVGLVFMASLVAVGPVLVQSYQQTRSVIASPYP